jgi:hypothetical protein
MCCGCATEKTENIKIYRIYRTRSCDAFQAVCAPPDAKNTNTVLRIEPIRR